MNGDVYSMVNKKTGGETAGPSAPSEPMYSQVNKPPKGLKPDAQRPGTSRPGNYLSMSVCCVLVTSSSIHISYMNTLMQF